MGCHEQSLVIQKGECVMVVGGWGWYEVIVGPVEQKCHEQYHWWS